MRAEGSTMARRWTQEGREKPKAVQAREEVGAGAVVGDGADAEGGVLGAVGAQAREVRGGAADGDAQDVRGGLRGVVHGAEEVEVRAGGADEVHERARVAAAAPDHDLLRSAQRGARGRASAGVEGRLDVLGLDDPVHAQEREVEAVGLGQGAGLASDAGAVGVAVRVGVRRGEGAVWGVGEDAERGADQEALARLGGEAADVARAGGLDVERGLGGLDDEEELSLGDLLALGDVDLGELELALVGVDEGDEDRLHVVVSPQVSKKTVMFMPTWRRRWEAAESLRVRAPRRRLGERGPRFPRRSVGFSRRPVMRQPWALARACMVRGL
jgi:hypothetical protein